MKVKHIHLTHTVPPELAKKRLDQVLAQLFPDYSRNVWQSWIKAGYVKVDGESKRPRDPVEAAQSILVDAELTEQADWAAQPIALDVIYQDDALIVINKPAGLVVHPGAGNPDQTLLNALLHIDPSLAHLPRAGIVHRLDKDTSGLMVVARTLPAHHALIKQISDRQVKREYHTIVDGTLISGGSVDAPIGRHRVARIKMAVTTQGKEAITHYRIIERFPHHTYLKVLLETGRTHQIRVHMAHIHHPLVGDRTYRGRLKIPAGCSKTLAEALQTFPRQALHARRLTLTHPESGELISWEAPVPDDMEGLLSLLRE